MKPVVVQLPDCSFLLDYYLEHQEDREDTIILLEKKGYRETISSTSSPSQVERAVRNARSQVRPAN